MSAAAWRLFQKAYADQPGSRVPLACLFLKLAGDSLCKLRASLIGSLLGLRYVVNGTPADQWEELILDEILAVQREMSQVFEAIDEVRKFFQRKVDARRKIEENRLERIDWMRREAEDEGRIRERFEAELAATERRV